MSSESRETALLQLLAALDSQGYRFITPTPATHERVLTRPDRREAADVRDVFGWNLPFRRSLLPEPIWSLLSQAEAVAQVGDKFKSRFRVSSIGERLFLHSAFPTAAENSVFFGPDTYRYVDFVRSELPRAASARRLVDIGAGTGAGAIMASALLPGARLTLLDINPAALHLASINARHAGLEVELIEGGSLDEVPGLIDLVIANPPYIIDDRGRRYRDGGGLYGAQLSLDWTLAAARRLERGGRMLLYTGVAMVDGRDHLREALERELPGLGCILRYREIDPDIFGEELQKPAYTQVERIAAIGAVVERLGDTAAG